MAMSMMKTAVRAGSGVEPPVIPEMTLPEFVLRHASARHGRRALVEANTGRELDYADVFRAFAEMTTVLALPSEIFARPGMADLINEAAAGREPFVPPGPGRPEVLARTSSRSAAPAGSGTPRAWRPLSPAIQSHTMATWKVPRWSRSRVTSTWSRTAARAQAAAGTS
jgi:hypothetical protein